ncbi:hypothetical protein GJ23_gp61 [Lactococcus phage P118]|uniref:Uncharacterized protein n=1 Tax=Lactococcus phage P118 TaxID=1476888 RepID=X4YUV2_9CAUD|nr:hypothetical protein GJ23_gp61 [Lactococcus phage P118]AHV83178.1 hypothetical protein P118_0061 [Lactococcus phage P118]
MNTQKPYILKDSPLYLVSHRQLKDKRFRPKHKNAAKLNPDKFYVEHLDLHSGMIGYEPNSLADEYLGTFKHLWSRGFTDPDISKASIPLKLQSDKSIKPTDKLAIQVYKFNLNPELVYSHEEMLELMNKFEDRFKKERNISIEAFYHAKEYFLIDYVMLEDEK